MVQAGIAAGGAWDRHHISGLVSVLMVFSGGLGNPFGVSVCDFLPTRVMSLAIFVSEASVSPRRASEKKLHPKESYP